MYQEYETTNQFQSSQVLALDWDETTTDYPLAFKELATHFKQVIIVTVNDELTLEQACKWLNRTAENLRIFCCPDENIVDVSGWKSDICVKEQVALMFDDSPDVVKACHQKGINAICVSERSWKFEND